MKHQCKLVTILVAGLLSANAAQAALSGNGNGLVYDSVLNVTWSSDANLLGTMLASDPSLVSKIIAAVPTVTNTPNADSPTGIYTLSAGDFNTTIPGTMNWWAAKAWVGYLNSTRYLGQNTWSLPTADLTCGGGSGGYNCTNGQLGALFYNSLGGVALQSITTTHNAGYSLFTSIQSGVYWYGTEYGGYPYNAWVFGTNNGGQGGGNKGRGDYFYTWAMLPGNVSTIAAVPEPGEWVMMLAGFGLIGAIVRRRKQI